MYTIYNDASVSRRPLELKTFSTKITCSAMIAMGLISVVLITLVAVGATMDVQSEGHHMFMISVARERWVRRRGGQWELSAKNLQMSGIALKSIEVWKEIAMHLQLKIALIAWCYIIWESKHVFL